MKRSTVRHPSRLVPQRPVKKTKFLAPGRSQNNYRRRRSRGASERTWPKVVFFFFTILVLTCLSLGLVFAYHQLLTWSQFCIKDISNIEIEGTKRLARVDILRQAGLGPESNLLAIKPGQVERALMAHPWIVRAELTRKWPHRLRLKIQERDPVVLAQIGEELFYVDPKGNLFKSLSPGDPHNFPIITGLKQEHFLHAEGALPEMVAQTFQLLEVLKEARPPLNLENIAEVHVDLERGFTLYANGLQVALDLGFKDHPEKLQKFARLWPVLIQKGYLARIGRINLNYPQRALVTLKGMGESQ